jgi:hypothetical protein
MKNEHDVKMLKIDVFNFEDNLFDDKSIIVECTLRLDNEYIIKAMIDNDCTDYYFIDTDIAREVCEVLEISFLKLNKSREVKNYDGVDSPQFMTFDAQYASVLESMMNDVAFYYLDDLYVDAHRL